MTGGKQINRCSFCKVRLAGGPITAGAGNESCSIMCSKCAGYIEDVEFRSPDRERVCECGHNLSVHMFAGDDKDMPCGMCDCNERECSRCDGDCAFYYCDVEHECKCKCSSVCNCHDFEEEGA